MTKFKKRERKKPPLVLSHEEVTTGGYSHAMVKLPQRDFCRRPWWPPRWTPLRFCDSSVLSCKSVTRYPLSSHGHLRFQSLSPMYSYRSSRERSHSAALHSIPAWFAIMTCQERTRCILTLWNILRDFLYEFEKRFSRALGKNSCTQFQKCIPIL